jgi:quercetin dioxygenase-like cupin family protein
MHKKNIWIAIVIMVFIALNISAQSGDDIKVEDSKKFTIDNCVNEFDMTKIVDTKVGYQYWFADKEFLDGRTLKMSVVAPHKATHAPHTHKEDEFFFILEGEAEFYLDDDTTSGGKYTSFYCSVNSKHGIKNIGDTELKYLVIKKYILDK